ncbi:hypothetical protein QWY28_00490 [Nocardioides sp. SOB77]|uniref:Uncharacterized protein n=1 Tax=Nocardioides oceani TaxID=3058369 RepID=A0ABT8F9R5_9ACTN|nr:hypothetical protein [Nocardioides oceani]MDN4171412.1 hypothetical protein [Nocardioides oceani]
MEPAEVLEQPGRTPLRRRTRWVLAVAALVLVAGWAADHELREREQRAVERCADATAAATARTDASMAMIRTYVQPALLSVPSGSSQDGFFALVAEEAREAEPRVRDALARCEEVDVLAVHLGLTERRDAYVAHLSARADWLAEIGADGRAYYRDRPELARLREAALGDRP